LPNDITSSIISVGNKIRECFNEAVKSLLEKNKEIAHKVLIMMETTVNKSIESAINKFTLTQLDFKSVISLGLIGDSLKRILDYSMDIAELTIDATA
ncbi:MAG TPA: PhoU domain-containing protein, partial [Desulfurococcales archaeon]|nr:PhoU domain-containing protein [Desulfurococcales archaeon]